MDDGLQRAVNAAGTRYALAKALKISPAAIYKWRNIPVERMLDIERITGVPRELLRPDLYRQGRVLWSKTIKRKTNG